MNAAEALIAAYIRGLDDRDFESWLALFWEDAVYAVIHHQDQARGTNLLILRESPVQLRNRIEAGVTMDGEMQVHLVSGLAVRDASAAGLSAVCNFLVMRGGHPTFSGRYELRCETRGGDVLKISDCRLVLANRRAPEPLYLPI
jgi:3-phenylpropionate/cinnamic acid dioxygenase small subunit